MGMAAESQFHVLAVDDSLIDRKLIEKLLKTSSYQVTTVDSGSKALEFLGLRENDQSNPKTPSVSLNNNQEVDVNLVITDYCMPGMTGYDLLKKIKESSSLRNIPVVIMSSENVPSRITRCLEEGAEEFFLKPVRLSDLNRLRPHMMKTQKLKKDQKLEDEEDEILETQEIEQAPLSLVEQQHQQSLVEQQHQQSLVEQQHQQSLVEQQHQQSLVEQQHPQPLVEQHQQSLIEQQQSLANNKRKTMEEGLSIETDRTRARYNGIATVV